MDAQSIAAKPAFTAFFQNALEAISASGFCLFSAQSFVPAVLFKLGPHHPVTRAVGKIATHLGLGVRLLLWMAPVLRFNSVFLFPHAEALRLITWLPFYTGSFLKLGERGYNMERLYNYREGLTRKDDSLPDRLTKTPQDEKNPKTVVRLDKMLPVYYHIRGWDENGEPRKRTLKRLGINI